MHLAQSHIKDKYETDDALYSKVSRHARILGFVLLTLLLYTAYFITALYVKELANNVWWILSPLSVLAGSYKIMKTAEQRHVHKFLNRFWRYIIGIAFMMLGFWGIYAPLKSGYSVAYFPFICLSYLIAMFFQLLMYARSKESAVMKGRLLGFKEFIRTAELDRIKMLVEDNPQYFYEILPYAYVFGLTSKWIKHFENIPLEQPSWYQSYDTEFHTIERAFALKQFASSFNMLNSNINLRI